MKINFRLLITIGFNLLSLLASNISRGQDWIAPEGKIINDRTLVWIDFHGKPGKGEEQYAAATAPAIYFTADNPEEHPNNRLTYNFKVKCAFQSASWVREAVADEKGFSEYALNHEQEHYDIALTFTYILQAALSGRDYSMNNYQAEIDSLYEAVYKKYDKTQDDYDGETKHGLVKEIQSLWDMRIKKCLENYTEEFYNKPLKDIQTVTYLSQRMKRIPNEPARQFAVRCRPMYSEYNDELNAKLQETKEWTPDKAVIAFYCQNFRDTDENAVVKENKRMLAYAFMPQPGNFYKRVLIDTFLFDGKPPKITGVFYANADSDQTRELFITTSRPVKERQRSGVYYQTYVYDNTLPKSFPARLIKLNDIAAKLSGLEGTENGKPSKAPCKSEKEVTDQLKKLGY